MRRGTSWGLLAGAALAVVLAAAPLSRVYSNLAYLPELVAAVLVAFACGWVARRLDVPTALAPAVACIGLVELLTLLYFRGVAFGGVLPTRAVFEAAGRAVRAAFHDIYTLAAPVEPVPEIVMVTLAGVFAAAVVVDLLVFRSRQPVSAGLPLLALFVIPASLSHDGAGWLSFALAAAGYLGLLSVEGRDRVRRWGRRLDLERPGLGLGDSAPIFRVARSIGAAAIGLALVVPGLIPGLGHGLLTGRGADVGGGSGRGGSGLVNPIVNLQASLRSGEVNEIIRVYTDSKPEYLRTTALDQFNGRTWIAGFGRGRDRPDAKKDIPLPPGTTTNTTFARYDARLQISKEHGSGSYLPVPYSPVKIDDLDGTWRYDDRTRSFYSPTKNVRGSSYTVHAAVPVPDAATVSGSQNYSPDVRSQADVAPTLIDPLVRRVAARVTRSATSPWDKAVALEDYFARSGGFRYSLDVPTGFGDPLRSFIINKIGYCEQYAGAMAAMARSIGLPARVVVGYTPGTRKDAYWSITNRDAHAWPELYFVDTGWVRFEPTPPQAGGGITRPTYATPAPVAPSAGPSATPTDGSTAGPGSDGQLPPGARDPALRDLPQGNGFGPPPGNGSRLPAWLWLALLAAASVPVLPALVRGVRRRWQRSHAADDAGRANVAWSQLEDDAGDLGYTWPSSSSPRVAGRSLVEQAGLSGEPASAVGRIGRAEELARYAAAPGSADRLFDDVTEVRKALLAGVPRRRRLAAMLFPRTAVRALTESLADGYVQVRRSGEAVRARARRLLTPGAARS